MVKRQVCIKDKKDKVIDTKIRHDYKFSLHEIDKWGNRYIIEIFYSYLPKKNISDESEITNVKKIIISEIQNNNYISSEKMEADIFWPMVEKREKEHNFQEERDKEILYIFADFGNCLT